MHILLLLENIKQHLPQLAATVNVLVMRTGSTPPVPCEMPEEFQFPLDSMEEVEEFENWIQNPENARRKQNLVSSLIFFDSLSLEEREHVDSATLFCLLLVFVYKERKINLPLCPATSLCAVSLTCIYITDILHISLYIVFNIFPHPTPPLPFFLGFCFVIH